MALDEIRKLEEFSSKYYFDGCTKQIKLFKFSLSSILKNYEKTTLAVFFNSN